MNKQILINIIVCIALVLSVISGSAYAVELTMKVENFKKEMAETRSVSSAIESEKPSEPEEPAIQDKQTEPDEAMATEEQSDDYNISEYNEDSEAAEQDILDELQISGFFDVLSSYQSSADDKSDFAFGQAELDIESDIVDNVHALVAVCYNGDDGGFELGVAALDMNVYTSAEQFVSSIDVTAGQFDIPFGIDYRVYASPDRKLVTGPMVVAHTHGGWNDIGFAVNMQHQYGDFVFYGVNGFASAAEVDSSWLANNADLSAGLNIGDEIDNSPAYAFGTRLGIAPPSLANIEFGGSFAVGINNSNKDEMFLAGADVQLSFSKLNLKGEYITHSLNRSFETKEENKGYYAQATYNLERGFIVGRYGSFKREGGDWTGRTSLGAGYPVFESVELRLETLINNDNSDENATFLQLVASF